MNNQTAVTTVNTELPNLPIRQRQTLILLLEGFTNKEIGAYLGITAQTARWHVSKILHIFACRNRKQLIAQKLHLKKHYQQLG